MAEQDDEFDVTVGDMFIISSRAKGWWVVQRDLIGTGAAVGLDMEKGWVPAGCLLETKVPVAVAVEAANAARAPSDTLHPRSFALKDSKPILPISVLSISYPKVALVEYKRKGDKELDLNKDDLLRVYKRYNHWSYVVKELSGDRGWVPSWLIGTTPITANWLKARF